MDEKPRKKRVSKVPKKEKSNIDVQSLLKELLNERILEDEEHYRDVHDLTKALVLTLSEFLGCFQLLGYDNEGSPIVLSYAKSEMQRDALNTLLFKFFSANAQKFNKQNPGDGLYEQ